MSRLWVSILTLVIYGLAQFGVILFHMAGLFNNLSSKELVFANIYTPVSYTHIRAHETPLPIAVWRVFG